MVEGETTITSVYPPGFTLVQGQPHASMVPLTLHRPVQQVDPPKV